MVYDNIKMKLQNYIFQFVFNGLFVCIIFYEDSKKASNSTKEVSPNLNKASDEFYV